MASLELLRGEMLSCRIGSCGASLVDLKKINQRCRLCEACMRAPLLAVGGAAMRFCQQCSRLDDVANFDGARRSCRKGLMKISKRRRQAKARILCRQVRSGCLGSFPSLFIDNLSAASRAPARVPTVSYYTICTSSTYMVHFMYEP